MDFEKFKAAWDAAHEKWRTEDPDNHSLRILHDVMGQFVTSLQKPEAKPK